MKALLPDCVGLFPKPALAFALVLAAGTLLLTTGCASRHDITLTNQHVITSRNKPKVDKVNNTVTFIDATGKKQVIPLFTVLKIDAR